MRKVRAQSMCRMLPNCSGHLKFADPSPLGGQVAASLRVRIFSTELRDWNALTLSESEFYSPSNSAEQNSPQWRQEVALRVRAHRARRRRRVGQEGAMELQFDPPAAIAAADTISETCSQGWTGAADAQANAAWRTIGFEEGTSEPALPQPPAEGNLEMEPEAADEILHSSGPVRPTIDLTEAPIAAEAYQPLPSFPRVKPQRRERKVIEFPRLNESSLASRDELAEPVGDQLRIFEAIEELPPLTLGPLADIRLPSPEAEAEPASDKFDLPLPVASCGRRGLAMAVDAFIMLAGLAVFSASVFYLASPVILTKPVLLAWALCALLLLTFYQSIFLFYSAGTPGMRAAGLILTDFSGAPPSRRIRVTRAFALVLSFAALCLGLIWAFIDEDRLGWHDRITHTYLREG